MVETKAMADVMAVKMAETTCMAEAKAKASQSKG
jgi:hypothetical protein